MSTIIETSQIKLTRTDAGVLRIGNTRVSLDSILIAFNQGATPEQILYDYDTLTLNEVYAAISYYLQHKAQVDAYLEERRVQNEEIRKETEGRFNHQGLREKLLARRLNAA
jgi:uncharacterized protein (DUF433 family)